MLELIGQVPAHAAGKFGDRIALVFKEREFSYNELHELIERAAAGLFRLGVRKNDVVTLHASNSWQYIVSYYAIFRLGAIANPVAAQLKPHDIEYIVNDCKAKSIIASAEVVNGIVGLKDRTSVLSVIAIADVVPDGALSFDVLLDHDLPSVEPITGNQKGLSTICYTSGTTGQPKGVMQSHKAVLTNTIMFSEMHNIRSEDCLVTPLPLTHVMANVLMNSTMIGGMKTVLHPSFDPAAMLADMQRYRATVVYGVPPMYLTMLNHPAMASADLSSLTRGCVAAAPLPEAAIDPVEKAFGIELSIAWGMTELAGGGSYTPVLGENRFGSAGIALPHCQMQVVDLQDANRILPAGEPGELMYKGPIVMMGYLGNEAATREVLRPDGWMHTGDIATMDDDGYVTIVDRKKDMLIVGASNVFPTEIEHVLAKHPAITQVAVGSQLHLILGQVPKAYVMLKDGSVTSEDEIIAYCRERLADFKCVQVVQVVTDLPRNPTGKVLRHRLKELDVIA